MRNRKTIMILVSLSTFVLMLVALQAVMGADNRINQVHHFGGDALFCTQEQGCWMLNMNGEQLWDVPQTTIDEVMTVACETSKSQFIDAGVGTYGPVTLGVSCYLGYDPSLKLIGYDEWGKLNVMPFPATYEPVYAPPALAPTPTPEKTAG